MLSQFIPVLFAVVHEMEKRRDKISFIACLFVVRKGLKGLRSQYYLLQYTFRHFACCDSFVTVFLLDEKNALTFKAYTYKIFLSTFFHPLVKCPLVNCLVLFRRPLSWLSCCSGQRWFTWAAASWPCAGPAPPPAPSGGRQRKPGVPNPLDELESQEPREKRSILIAQDVDSKIGWTCLMVAAGKFFKALSTFRVKGTEVFR